jgi:hypothetical protein
MTRITAIATFAPSLDALEQRNIALAQELEAKERELRMAQERIAELEIALKGADMKSIILRADEVRAVLGGSAEIRREVKPQPRCGRLRKSDAREDGREYWLDYSKPYEMPPVPNAPGDSYMMPSLPIRVFCPFGAPGTALWVRELVAVPLNGIFDGKQSILRYRADDNRQGMPTDLYGSNYGSRWGITPKRWSRLNAEVTAVRVERDDAGTWNWVVDLRWSES